MLKAYNTLALHCYKKYSALYNTFSFYFKKCHSNKFYIIKEYIYTSFHVGGGHNGLNKNAW
jgi:hypothetical protein